MSNQDYHGEREWLGSSALKMLLQDPWQFHLWQSNLLPPRDPTDSMKIGTIVDDMISGEPPTYFVWRGDRRTKAGKEQWADAVSSGFLMVTEEQHAKAQMMVEAVWESEPAYKMLVEDQGESQASCFGTVSFQGQNVQVKCRWDRRLANGDVIELKTRKDWEMPHWGGVETYRDAHLLDWRRQVRKYSYDMQGYLYTFMSDRVEGRDTVLGQIPQAKHFFVTCTNVPPYQCFTYRTSDKVLERGATLLESALAEYISRKEFDNWRPFSWGEIIPL